MAKSKDATGKMDDQLKEKTETLKDIRPVLKKEEQTVLKKEDQPVLKDEMISKPEVDLLARKFANAKKEDQLPLRETVKEVKDRNKALQELKKSRKQQSVRIIRDLRQYDPIGKKTCGRCAHRVLIETMDSKKELCEVCAS